MAKWQTMPDVMLRYRAASFFGKLYAPELLMVLQTSEEVCDATIVMEPGEDGGFELSLDDLQKDDFWPGPSGIAGNSGKSQGCENLFPRSEMVFAMLRKHCP